MDVETLPQEVQEYIYSIERKADKAVRAWEKRYTSLEEQYKLLLLQKFGRKSEKESFDTTQQFLFDSESHASPEQDTEDSTTIIKAYPRNKPGRKPIDESIPREEVIIDIQEEEKQCACGYRLIRIGEEISEKLQVIPPKMLVEWIVRPKYACKVCAMYSLIETAKQNGANPNDYLQKIFEMASSARTEEDWKLLLPWNITL